MKILVLCLVLVNAHFLTAQSGSIMGVIIDKVDLKPMEFVRVALFKTVDSSLFTGTISNDLGQFKLDMVLAGTYYLDVKFIGFETKYVSNINIRKGQVKIEVDTLELITSNTLKDVEVTAEKSFVETKIDKKVYNAEQSIAVAGGTGLDLMKEIPSVTVDENDNILLRGDPNVTVLIDGRPTAMLPSDLLKQYPAATIDKIEIITNPSAKYDPEGMSGIINVILKKEKQKGFNGSARSSFGYGDMPKFSMGLDLNYRNKKVNLYGTYNYNYRTFWYGGTANRNVRLGDTTWNRLETTDRGNRRSAAHFGKLGVDYFLNDRNTVYLSGLFNNSVNLGDDKIAYQNLDEDNVTLNYSNRFSIRTAPSQNFELNTGWQKSFKSEGHLLDVDLNYSQNNEAKYDNLNEDFFGENELHYLTTYQETTNNTNRSVFIGKVDYTLPIDKSLTVESGFHYTVRLMENGLFSKSGIDETNLTEDLNLNNKFKYNQNTYAAYTTIGKQFKAIGLKVGLRAEQTNTNSELINTNDAFVNNYFELFPSGHLSYKTTQKSEFQFSYSRRINRPKMYQINPFPDYSNPLVLEQGNPFLKPETIHVNELSYMKFWNKFNFSTTLHHRIITNRTRRELSNDGLVSIVSYNNLGKSTLSGGDFALVFRPIKGLRIMSNSTVWITSTNDEVLTGGLRRYFMGVNTSIRASMKLKKGFTTQLWLSYSPTSTVIQGKIFENYGGGLGLSKQILKEKGNLSLTVSDLLNTRQFTFQSNNLIDYDFITNRQWESRVINLSFSYRFGKVIEGKQRRNLKDTTAGDGKSAPGM